MSKSADGEMADADLLAWLRIHVPRLRHADRGFWSSPSDMTAAPAQGMGPSFFALARWAVNLPIFEWRIPCADADRVVDPAVGGAVGLVEH
jgi:hypothetical protein